MRVRVAKRQERKSMNKKLSVFTLILAVAAVGAGAGGYYYSDYLRSSKEMEEIQALAYDSQNPAEEVSVEASVEASTEVLADSSFEASSQITIEVASQDAANVIDCNSESGQESAASQIPVDIKTLQKTNPDIKAWVSVPDTAINYPIAQHPTDDFYYLKHGPDGRSSSYGCPYIELCDVKPFAEFNTVVYGHNMNDGSMFAGLHKFEDKDFFDKHKKIYIYTSEHSYSYEVFAAVMYSDARIPYYYDDAKESDRTAFLKSLSTNIVAERSIVSDDIKKVSKDSKILTLSTCDKKLRDKRFIVVAKLTQIDGKDVTK
jgi:sortase B